MKFRDHLIAEIIIFTLLYFLLGFNSAIIITLVHFVPSIDYLMNKLNFHPKLHRQLFHNIFIIAISSGVIFYFTNFQIGILSLLN
ncbi:MAG: hypothetical protein JSW73_02450, partial [Candidatus Woesearchaeota archaeon]